MGVCSLQSNGPSHKWRHPLTTQIGCLSKSTSPTPASTGDFMCHLSDNGGSQSTQASRHGEAQPLPLLLQLSFNITDQLAKEQREWNSCLNALSWDISSLPAFGLQLKHWLILVLKPAALRLELHISSHGYPVCQLQIL